jgi:hypothetical protein
MESGELVPAATPFGGPDERFQEILIRVNVQGVPFDRFRSCSIPEVKNLRS